MVVAADVVFVVAVVVVVWHAVSSGRPGCVYTHTVRENTSQNEVGLP